MRTSRFLLLTAAGFASFVSSADNLSSGNVYVPGIERFAPESGNVSFLVNSENLSSEQLKAVGAKVEFGNDGQYLVSMPRERVAEFMSFPGVKRASVPRQVNLDMNFSRPYTGVTEILSGTPGGGINEDIIPYTGKGVVVGVVDTGIDPTHVTFLNKEMTASRVKKYVLTRSVVESYDGEFIAQVYDSPDDVPVGSIDTTNSGHGTHVASIAGGAYQGNDYFGNAVDADLVFISTGQGIFEDEMIYGMNFVQEYAASVGAPAVLNFSMSHTVGAHDGTSEICLAADAVAQKGVIPCFSAGNSGQLPNSLRIDKNQTYSFGLMSTGGSLPPMGYNMQVWSNDTRAFKVSMALLKYGSRSIIAYTPEITFPLLSSDENEPVYLISEFDDVNVIFPEWNEYFAGNISLRGGIDPVNGRFFIDIMGMVTSPQYGQPNYFPVINITPVDDARGIVYSDESTCYISNLGIKSLNSGSTDETISDFCTTESVISVGMMNASPYYDSLAGGRQNLNTSVNGALYAINPYSSYGTENNGKGDGRVLPDIVAPGTIVAAAYNSYISSYNNNYLVDRRLINGREYFWGVNTGTSMSSPNVAGIVALWLEADPSLTVDDIRNVLKNTGTFTVYMYDEPMRTAYGQIKAYDGLKYILTNKSGIHTPESEDNRLMVRFLSPRRIECVLSAGVSSSDVWLTGTDGRRVYLGRCEGQVFEKTLPDDKGIYLLTVEPENGAPTTTKLILK